MLYVLFLCFVSNSCTFRLLDLFNTNNLIALELKFFLFSLVFEAVIVTNNNSNNSSSEANYKVSTSKDEQEITKHIGLQRKYKTGQFI
jgi:hypothetical protein